MKRHWLVWIAVVVHLVLAVTSAIGGWEIYKTSGSPNITANGKDVLRGLMIGIGACLGCALVYGVVSLGLWKRWRWTWWLGVGLSGLIAGLILMDPLTESHIDWDDVWIGLCFVAVVVLLLLPPVRRYMFRRDAVPKVT